MEPASSWILAGFVTIEPQWELLEFFVFFYFYFLIAAVYAQCCVSFRCTQSDADSSPL